MVAECFCCCFVFLPCCFSPTCPIETFVEDKNKNHKQLLFLSILDFITLNRVKNKTWGIFLFSIKKHHSHTGVQITHLSLWVFANLITQQIETRLTCTLAVGRILRCSAHGQVSGAS